MRLPAAAVCAWLALASAARAVEVSLEENKAERGSIGYVDLQLLFKLYPETQKAKQNFEDVVRQAEEQVNLRRAELIALRAELARLRLEREFLARLPVPIPAQEPPATPAPEVVSISTPVASIEGSTATVSGSTEAAAGSDTASSAPPPPLLGLPGLGPFPPGAGDGPATRPPASLAEVEQKLREKALALEGKEAEFKTYQGQVEKNLLELEGRRTEILLGKIYVAVQEVAREEKVGVVVDKSQILFGHKAVNLTEKVLLKIR